jgi:hypothetical protein
MQKPKNRRRSRRAKPRKRQTIRQQRERRLARVAEGPPHPFKLYRPARLAYLLGVDTSTLWRWRKAGLIEEPVQVGPSVHGWTGQQVARILKQQPAPEVAP